MKLYKPSVKLAGGPFVLPEPKYPEQKVAIDLLNTIEEQWGAQLHSKFGEIFTLLLVGIRGMIKDLGSEVNRAYNHPSNGTEKILNMVKALIYAYLGDPDEVDVKNFGSEDAAKSAKAEVRRVVRDTIMKLARELDNGDQGRALSSDNPSPDMG